MILPGPEHRNRRYQAVLLDFCTATKEAYILFSNARTPSSAPGLSQTAEGSATRTNESSLSTGAPASPLPVGPGHKKFHSVNGQRQTAAASKVLANDTEPGGILDVSVDAGGPSGNRVRPEALPAVESPSEEALSVADGRGQRRGQNHGAAAFPWSVSCDREIAGVQAANELLEQSLEGALHTHRASNEELWSDKNESACHAATGRVEKADLAETKHTLFRPVWLPAAAVLFAGLSHCRASDNGAGKGVSNQKESSPLKDKSDSSRVGKKDHSRTQLYCPPGQPRVSPKSIVEVSVPWSCTRHPL